MPARDSLPRPGLRGGNRSAARAGLWRLFHRSLGVLCAAWSMLAITLVPGAAVYAETTRGTAAHTFPDATILRVGPQRWLKTPSEAARLAKPGDTIEIDAGIYLNDYAVWQQENLTIRGIDGMAHMKSDTLIPNGKAIWIVSGDNTVIENIEFSGARVADTNGAGIRHQGGDLTLRNTYFHHNEFSVLTGPYPEASLEVSSSRFYFQKREGTFSHGIYVGGLGRFTITGSHFKGTDRGHQIKSRALENHTCSRQQRQRTSTRSATVRRAARREHNSSTACSWSTTPSSMRQLTARWCVTMPGAMFWSPTTSFSAADMSWSDAARSTITLRYASATACPAVGLPPPIPPASTPPGRSRTRKAFRWCRAESSSLHWEPRSGHSTTHLTSGLMKRPHLPDLAATMGYSP